VPVGCPLVHICAALKVNSISNEGHQYAVESLVCIHLVKEHKTM
jgi:hypothetical protein